jgi:membrane-associated phospholipid phosphatase
VRERFDPAIFAALVILLPARAAAQPTPAEPSAQRDRPQAFEPAWQPEVGFADFLVTGAGVSVAVAGAVTPPRSAHFTARNSFDEGVRDALRLPRLDDRYEIRDASDVGLSLLVTWPFLVDALVTAYYLRGNAELAKNMAFVSAEVLAVNSGVQGLTNTIASRERPFGRDCGGAGLPGSSIECDNSVRYRSFFSGHASNAFAAAGAICVWHTKLGLLGAPGDALSCAGAYAFAAATATFRIMGDMHYASDVLTGAAVGSVLGVGLPLMHGRTRNEPEDDGKAGLRVRVQPVGAGVGVGGTF